MYSLLEMLKLLSIIAIAIVLIALRYMLDSSKYGFKNAFKNFGKGLLGLIILSFLFVGVDKSQFYYIQTSSGKDECISNAKTYLNENYLNNKYEITDVKDNGDIEYTIYNNDGKLDKEVQLDTYMNYKKDDGNYFWFIPWFIPVR